LQLLLHEVRSTTLDTSGHKAQTLGRRRFPQAVLGIPGVGAVGDSQATSKRKIPLSDVLSRVDALASD
jgi:hypothetical protein